MASSTSPDGIVFPDASDPIAPLNAVFQDLAESVQTALDGVPSLNVDVTSPSYGQVISYDPASDNFTNNPDNNPVMVFDDATARTTAIPTPVEGMVTYLKDTDAVEKYDGSAFVSVGGGKIVDVKTVFKTNIFSASVTGKANVQVTDLSITHAMSDASNKLLITAYFGVAANSDGKGQIGIAVHDGSALIGVGDSAGSRTPVSAGGEGTSGGDTSQVVFPNVTIPYEPGDTSSRTYTVRAINIRNTTYTLYVNRNQNDGDTGSTPRGVSALIIQEVAG